MKLPVKFMVERLKKLPGNAFIVQDGSKVFAAVGDELVIFKGEPGEFNKMTEHQLAAFIRKNADKQGTPVEEETPVYHDGDWFIDETSENHDVWEAQYIVTPDGNHTKWNFVGDSSMDLPKGRRVEAPDRSEWDLGHKEEIDGEESSNTDS